MRLGQQLFSALFLVCIAHAFGTMQVAAEPAAFLLSFDQDGKFSAGHSNDFPLSSADNPARPGRFFDGDFGNEQVEIGQCVVQQISLSQIVQGNERPLIMDDLANPGGWFSTKRAHHTFNDNSARARAKGTEVLRTLRQAPKTKEVWCV